MKQVWNRKQHQVRPRPTVQRTNRRRKAISRVDARQSDRCRVRVGRDSVEVSICHSDRGHAVALAIPSRVAGKTYV